MFTTAPQISLLCFYSNGESIASSPVPLFSRAGPREARASYAGKIGTGDEARRAYSGIIQRCWVLDGS